MARSAIAIIAIFHVTIHFGWAKIKEMVMAKVKIRSMHQKAAYYKEWSWYSSEYLCQFM